MKKLLMSLLLITASTASAASMYETYVSMTPELGTILDDIGRKCGVNAKEADGTWIGMAMNSGANETHRESAFVALKKGDQAKYKAAIDQMVCP